MQKPRGDCGDWDSGVICGEKEEWADEDMTVKAELGRASNGSGVRKG